MTRKIGRLPDTTVPPQRGIWSQVVDSTDPEVLEGIGIMNLAYGYVAQTLQTHDELVAAGTNERRRIATDSTVNGHAGGRRPSLGQRIGQRMHRRSGSGLHGAHAAH